MSKTEEPTPIVANLKAPPIYKIFVTQSIATLIAALSAFVLFDLVTGCSVFLGGMTSTLPNAYFAIKAFRYRGARQIAQAVKSFYAGESGKMIITAVMFAMVFAGVKPLNELAVIISYILILISGLIATATLGLKKN
ncbi:MAG: ATP synthase subunit I [Gammaproteobacteria bacterium]|jgi:ATP synthase protein I|nr:ATP synthase subunit I [Gammaproteobacteria bacterium]